jgi:2-alkyl-3-oxoalkanoate reductase
MRRALVTGATGGLGIALVQTLLDEGYAVRATGRQPAALDRLAAMGAQTVAADLLDTDLAALCAERDVVFHVAGLSSPWGPDEAFELANVETTRLLLTAAQAEGVGSFVFVSSPSVYARWRDQTGLTEATPWPHQG